MNNNGVKHLTVQDLYAWAVRNRLVNARIRITDGDLVSIYPYVEDTHRGVYEVIIDISTSKVIDLDELSPLAKRVYE